LWGGPQRPSLQDVEDTSAIASKNKMGRKSQNEAPKGQNAKMKLKRPK